MPGEIKWSEFTAGDDMRVGDISVGLRSGVNFKFTFPENGIQDINGNMLVGWSSSGASAVNYILLQSANTGNPAILTSAGTDVSPGLTLETQGNGDITFTPGGSGIITASTHLILSTSSPLTSLEAASKGYVDSKVIATPVSLADGGTSASLTASNGGIFYSTATQGAILSGTPTANQVLLSGLSSAPSWSTATYPVTTTASQLLYSSSANTITGLITANNGLLVTNATGVPSILAGPGTTGQIVQANAAAAPSFSAASYPSSTTINQLLYSSSNNSITGLATANNGVLITSSGGVPSIGSTLPLAVQSNITQVGTITSGTWNGTIISPQYGGTGVNNGSSTITIGGSFTMSGAFTFTGTLTGNTSVTFPTSGTLATTSSIPSLPLSLSNGGTGTSLTASNGGIVYSTASTLAILSGTATANQIVMSGSNTNPSWSTAVYPATTTINQLLYSSSSNVISGLTSANSSVLLTTSAGVPQMSGALTNGQIIIGSTGATPVAATLTAGANISITNAAGSITITGTGLASFSWVNVTGTSQAMLPNKGYIVNNGSGLPVTLTLPATSAVGDEIDVIGKSIGGWTVQCGGGQTIVIGDAQTSSGGTLASTQARDSFYMICTVANTEWTVGSGPQSSGLTYA